MRFRFSRITWRFLFIPCALVLVAGCGDDSGGGTGGDDGGGGGGDDGGAAQCVDNDGDGVGVGSGCPVQDCNDEDDTIHPFAVDIPGDGVDQDCDGSDPEGTCYLDDDGDGFGSRELSLPGDDPLCAQLGGVAVGGDCDEGDGAINPGADEIPADGVDQNCDGVELCFEDLDGDGFGTQTTVPSGEGDLVCAGAGLSVVDTDCDDGDDAVNPDGDEIAGDGVDQDCDGVELCFEDGDGDGFGIQTTVESEAGDLLCAGTGVSPVGTDCDDARSEVNPGANEPIADGQDWDCDGMEFCYLDSDNDGYGADATTLSAVGDLTCSATGLSNVHTDCDDTDSDINPPATELPGDGVDQNCDNIEICHVDSDGDGYGTDATAMSAVGDVTCSAAFVSMFSTDCDDNDGAFHPNAVETPLDGVDQDCDRREICYLDSDNDGFGIDATTLSAVGDLACSGNYVSTVTTDCDDTDPDINPAATDIPGDGVDQNCDNQEICYADNDHDGFGGTEVASDPGDLTCSATDLSSFSTDCDDTDGAIHPNAVEIPMDGVDQDCDGMEICYLDSDNDGYGIDATALSTVGDVTCTGPGVSLVNTDCNDGKAGINPGALEGIPTDVDNDCDGNTEDVFPFQFGDAEFVNPRTPVVNATTGHYLLHVTADERIENAVSDFEVGTTDLFPVDGAADGTPVGKVTWEGPNQNYPLAEGLDSLADGNRFYNITSFQRVLTTPQGPELRTYIRMHRGQWNAANQVYDVETTWHFVVTDDVYLDFDIAIVDNGWIQGVGCGNHTIHYIRAENNANGQFRPLWYFAKDFRHASYTYAIGHGCIIEPRPSEMPLVWAFNDGTIRDGVRAHAFELEVMDIPLVPSATTWLGYGVLDANRDHHSGVVTLAGDSTNHDQGVTVYTGSAIEYLLQPLTARSADARMHNGQVVMAAVVDDITLDGRRDLILAYGDPSAPLTAFLLPFEHPTLDLEPEGVSLHVDANRIFLGVSGINRGAGRDDVGWLFLGNGL